MGQGKQAVGSDVAHSSSTQRSFLSFVQSDEGPGWREGGEGRQETMGAYTKAYTEGKVILVMKIRESARRNPNE